MEKWKIHSKHEAALTKDLAYFHRSFNNTGKSYLQEYKKKEDKTQDWF